MKMSITMNKLAWELFDGWKDLQEEKKGYFKSVNREIDAYVAKKESEVVLTFGVRENGQAS